MGKPASPNRGGVAVTKVMAWIDAKPYRFKLLLLAHTAILGALCWPGRAFESLRRAQADRIWPPVPRHARKRLYGRDAGQLPAGACRQSRLRRSGHGCLAARMQAWYGI